MLRIASLTFPSLTRFTVFCIARCQSSRSAVSSESNNRPVEFQDDIVKKLVGEELITIPDFITEEEEQSLLSEIDPILSRSRYQTAHWDNVRPSFTQLSLPKGHRRLSWDRAEKLADRESTGHWSVTPKDAGCSEEWAAPWRHSKGLQLWWSPSLHPCSRFGSHRVDQTACR